MSDHQMQLQDLSNVIFPTDLNLEFLTGDLGNQGDFERFLTHFFELNQYSLQESPLKSEYQGFEYWYTTIVDRSGHPLTGGFGDSKNQARKIAVSELLERTFFKQISTKNSTAEDVAWGLNLIPTACGFACGFDLQRTQLRSLGEAAERWVMSEWIDNKRYIEQIKASEIEPTLDPASQFFKAQFDDVLFFKKDIVIHQNHIPIAISIGQTMGLKGNGIYPGSSAQHGGGTIWQHALLESFRHLLLVKNNTPIDRFPYNKILYFSQNADIALKQIEAATDNSWIQPKIAMQKNLKLPEGYFIARTIIEGWKSWTEGPIERFLY